MEDGLCGRLVENEKQTEDEEMEGEGEGEEKRNAGSVEEGLRGGFKEWTEEQR